MNQCLEENMISQNQNQECLLSVLAHNVYDRHLHAWDVVSISYKHFILACN